MNQADLWGMAEQRILDAKALLEGGRWEFAYYVAGYAIECGLKSCILARMIHTGWIFQEKSKMDDCRTHDFGKLVGLAGLTNELNQQLAASAADAQARGGPIGGAFAGHWGTVTQWESTSRYIPRTETQAKALYEAITDKEGVLEWIRRFW